jgi:uncharacterized membrane protein
MKPFKQDDEIVLTACQWNIISKYISASIGHIPVQLDYESKSGKINVVTYGQKAHKIMERINREKKLK